MRHLTDKNFVLVQKALEMAHYEAVCLEPLLTGAFVTSTRGVKEHCKKALDALKEPQVEPSEDTSKGELMTVEDQTFALHDGHYCTVAGRIFGPWPDHGLAVAGMQVEQRRLKKRQEQADFDTRR